MNYVLDQLDELMVSVQNHDIAFIIVVVITLILLWAVFYLICFIHENLCGIRDLEKRLTERHNTIAGNLQKMCRHAELGIDSASIDG